MLRNNVKKMMYGMLICSMVCLSTGCTDVTNKEVNVVPHTQTIEATAKEIPKDNKDYTKEEITAVLKKAKTVERNEKYLERIRNLDNYDSYSPTMKLFLADNVGKPVNTFAFKLNNKYKIFNQLLKDETKPTVMILSRSWCPHCKDIAQAIYTDKEGWSKEGLYRGYNVVDIFMGTETEDEVATTKSEWELPNVDIVEIDRNVTPEDRLVSESVPTIVLVDKDSRFVSILGRGDVIPTKATTLLEAIFEEADMIIEDINNK